MDVLPNALPEQFFVDASDECLKALVPLVDLGIAKHFTAYCSSPVANPGVAGTIERYFTEAIRHATYHQELHDTGVVAILKELNLDAVCAMSSVQAMQALVDTIEKVTNNFDFIHSRIKPRTKSDYENFLSTCPAGYLPAITANRDYFYYPRAQEINTGLGYLVSHRQDLEIALKGLKTRLLFAKSGGAWEEGVKRL